MFTRSILPVLGLKAADPLSGGTPSKRRLVLGLTLIALGLAWPVMAASPTEAPPPEPAVTPMATPAVQPSASIVHKVQSASERMEMTVHTSRILTMEHKIAQAQVSNPNLLELTPLSPTQIQVAAKSAGITQINLWSEDRQIFTIDVVVLNDVRELQMVLRSTFPNAALKVVPVANAVLISGYVDKADSVERIVHIAEEYYPKVINNMTVAGVQQVLLHVKVMEVSRTKLRRLGFDFANINGSSVVGSGISGLLANSLNTSQSLATTVKSGTPSTFSFGVVNGNSAFFGFLDALRQDNLLKILSDPTLVTVSGRAANFNAGGEIPVPVPQSLGTISIDWKQYGTQIKFIPLVLGNGKIQLDVIPYISELDETHSTTINGTTVPGIRSRTADTRVEMVAGQTLAIAGLVQSRVEAGATGLPWISEVPYLNVLFGTKNHTINEVELLMLVTPEFVEPMDACEVPPGGPGMNTTNPSDWELYMKGHIEVPKSCPCVPCADDTAACPARPGDPAMTPPPEGMLQEPGQTIPTPAPIPMSGTNGSQPQDRYKSSKATVATKPSLGDSTNGPAGMIGPVGYDVVK
ncbi:MAG: pilus assembly protein N-terminal domain-containing protein [Planctomycetaceae bacterium]|nr:pilus assembly protein N-terminal domain-containing protein [Planctomycetaceae bacterium]